MEEDVIWETATVSRCYILLSDGKWAVIGSSVTGSRVAHLTPCCGGYSSRWCRMKAAAPSWSGRVEVWQAWPWAWTGPTRRTPSGHVEEEPGENIWDNTQDKKKLYKKFWYELLVLTALIHDIKSFLHHNARKATLNNLSEQRGVTGANYNYEQRFLKFMVICDIISRYPHIFYNLWAQAVKKREE